MNESCNEEHVVMRVGQGRREGKAGKEGSGNV